MSPKVHRRDLNGSPLLYQSDAVQVKPTVLESKVLGKSEFEGLSENFKQYLRTSFSNWPVTTPISSNNTGTLELKPLDICRQLLH